MGAESWNTSSMRYCSYPAGGSCTEHTDYGVLTLQHCNSPGLEAHIDGKWQPVCPPPGATVAFAGDMLERLTNGRTKALLHRVCMDPPSSPSDSRPTNVLHRPVVRQSHIIFLQPDWD